MELPDDVILEQLLRLIDKSIESASLTTCGSNSSKGIIPVSLRSSMVGVIGNSILIFIQLSSIIIIT